MKNPWDHKFSSTQNLRVEKAISSASLRASVQFDCAPTTRPPCRSTSPPPPPRTSAWAPARRAAPPRPSCRCAHLPRKPNHPCAQFSRSDAATPRGRTNNAPPPRGPEPATRRVESGGVPRCLVDFRYVSARERLRHGRLPRDARDPSVEPRLIVAFAPRRADPRSRLTVASPSRLAGLQEVLRAQALQHDGPERCVSRPRRPRGDCTRAVERGLPTASSVAHVSRHLGAKVVAQGASCVRAPPGERGATFHDGVSEDFLFFFLALRRDGRD